MEEQDFRNAARASNLLRKAEKGAGFSLIPRLAFLLNPRTRLDPETSPQYMPKAQRPSLLPLHGHPCPFTLPHLNVS